MENIFPFLIPLVVFMIPIIAILTSHQRRMAELIHGNRHNQNSSAEIDMLRRELQEVKQLVHQQTLAIDSLTRYQLPSAENKERFTGV